MKLIETLSPAFRGSDRKHLTVIEQKNRRQPFVAKDVNTTIGGLCFCDLFRGCPKGKLGFCERKISHLLAIQPYCSRGKFEIGFRNSEGINNLLIITLLPIAKLVLGCLAVPTFQNMLMQKNSDREKRMVTQPLYCSHIFSSKCDWHTEQKIGKCRSSAPSIAAPQSPLFMRRFCPHVVSVHILHISDHTIREHTTARTTTFLYWCLRCPLRSLETRTSTIVFLVSYSFSRLQRRRHRETQGDGA